MSERRPRLRRGTYLCAAIVAAIGGAYLLQGLYHVNATESCYREGGVWNRATYSCEQADDATVRR